MTKRLTATAPDGTFFDIYIGRPRKSNCGFLDMNIISNDGVTSSVTVPLTYKATIIPKLQVCFPQYVYIPDKTWALVLDEIDKYFEKELKRAKKERN